MSEGLTELARNIRMAVEECGCAVVASQSVKEILFDPTRRREVRVSFGLPDDGKEWCVACQKAHKPPVHEVTQ